MPRLIALPDALTELTAPQNLETLYRAYRRRKKCSLEDFKAGAIALATETLYMLGEAPVRVDGRGRPANGGFIEESGTVTGAGTTLARRGALIGGAEPTPQVETAARADYSNASPLSNRAARDGQVHDGRQSGQHDEASNDLVVLRGAEPALIRGRADGLGERILGH